MWDKDYNDNYKTPKMEISGDSEWYLLELDRHILLGRRKELGMTQAQVAEAAGIKVRQYQRFESGERTMAAASMRIGLSICAVLELDPYRFVPKI